ncbi:CoA ester lyase [Hwanghaeella grinnelliae]|uniref:CoA ester lyase n=1 Tax=Hwanghaeella grinnelliae TaxID=2500179 RepID=A0A3S2W5W9_9PROT|nr:CoA ester lyase [Hwanghaeella grinnelliae]RVU37960.1 CoA ester lyase [Hwanghaeella grinnelliae]
MAATSRPRRSVLYMPGSNTRAMEKGRSLPADALILDLEDAVAPDAKEQARVNIHDALAQGGYGKREILVRVNALDTAWGEDDLAAMATVGADGILLPKVESAETVLTAQNILDDNGGPADLAIWCMIETPLGVLHAEEIGKSSPRLGGFVMGTSDLAKDLHCLHTPDRLPFMTSLNMSVLVARAFGLAILDGVHLDLSDLVGFEASCKQGLELGFDGKTLIHPKTIDTANAVFGPTAEEVDRSAKIIEAFETATAESKGVVLLDGKLVENLHVENAKRVLALAAMIRELEAEQA